MTGPHIGIDGRTIGLEQGTGVATYAGMLAATLPLAGYQPDLLPPGPRLGRLVRRLRAAWPGAVRRTAPDLFRTAQVHFDIWGRPLHVAGRGLPDAMHWTYPLPLVMRGRPNLYTIHDLIPLTHPGMTGIDPERHRRLLRAILRHTAHVVTVSEAARAEIVVHLGLDPAQVTNTWQAVDVAGADPAPPPTPLTPAAYWLHVGTIEPRKNVKRLIEAWRASHTPHPLVLAGPDGFGSGAELAAVAGDPRVVRLPFQPRPRLLALIRDARALLMPSMAEGFGLPVAEAMALGTPVLTSFTGALAEIAGPAALLIDPVDTASLAAGLRAMEDQTRRQTLSAAGLDRARLFTPQAYAERLRHLYHTVLPRLRADVPPVDMPAPRG